MHLEKLGLVFFLQGTIDFLEVVNYLTYAVSLDRKLLIKDPKVYTGSG